MLDYSKSTEKPVKQCFVVSSIPKIFETKIREYPTLQPKNINNIQKPRYKERESPVMHIEKVSKNIGEHGRLQSLVENFIGQAVRWWDTHQTRLQTYTSALNYFVGRFGGKKLIKQAQIPIFTQGQNPEDHIKTCEKEWRKLGYKDERAWPHLFPSTLTDLPKKVYNGRS